MTLKQLQEKHNKRMAQNSKTSKTWGNIAILPRESAYPTESFKVLKIWKTNKRKSPLNGEVK